MNFMSAPAVPVQDLTPGKLLDIYLLFSYIYKQIAIFGDIHYAHKQKTDRKAGRDSSYRPTYPFCTDEAWYRERLERFIWRGKGNL